MVKNQSWKKKNNTSWVKRCDLQLIHRKKILEKWYTLPLKQLKINILKNKEKSYLDIILKIIFNKKKKKKVLGQKVWFVARSQTENTLKCPNINRKT